MNVSTFLKRFGIADHPFRDEEARQDAVFTKLSERDPEAAAHPDLQKIIGDLTNPTAAVVFGEKGAGKTAIRLQLEHSIHQHNGSQSDGASNRVFLIAYDDLNPVLDQLAAAEGLTSEAKDSKVLSILNTIRLVDHIDAMLMNAVTRITDALAGPDPAHTLAGVSRTALTKQLRRAPRETREDMLILAAVYGRQANAHERFKSLRKANGYRRNAAGPLWTLAMYLGWVIPISVIALSFTVGNTDNPQPWLYGTLAAAVLWGIAILRATAWESFMSWRIARSVTREVRTNDRDAKVLSQALTRLPASTRSPAILPTDAVDEVRYAMVARLRRVLKALGFTSVVVVIDRLDEPTLINGEADRMRAVAWPLLNNKFLQLEGVGFKMLLPVELRWSLLKESQDFFQSARLDKQNLIEQLSWTGPMLYDLCSARVNACIPGDGSSALRSEEDSQQARVRLIDLFDEDVSREDIVAALSDVAQPRDAFKLMYACIAEHCARVTEDDIDARIPRHVLETVRKAQSERVQMVQRGVRPG